MHVNKKSSFTECALKDILGPKGERNEEEDAKSFMK